MAKTKAAPKAAKAAKATDTKVLKAKAAANKKVGCQRSRAATLAPPRRRA